MRGGVGDKDYVKKGESRFDDKYWQSEGNGEGAVFLEGLRAVNYLWCVAPFGTICTI